MLPEDDTFVYFGICAMIVQRAVMNIIHDCLSKAAVEAHVLP